MITIDGGTFVTTTIDGGSFEIETEFQIIDGGNF